MMKQLLKALYMRCNECGKRFKSRQVGDSIQITCPACKKKKVVRIE